MDSINGNENEGDSALGSQLSRITRELSDQSRYAVKSLSDLSNRREKLFAERERLLARQKAETNKAATARRSEMTDCMDNSLSVHPMAKFARSASLSGGLAALRNSRVEDNKGTKGSSASSSYGKSGYFSYTTCNVSGRNGQPSFVNDNHFRNHVFSPGHKRSSGREDNDSNSDSPGNVSGEEPGCFSHARHNKFRRNDNHSMVSRNRTRNHEFSSRHEDSSYRPNKCFSTKGKHGNFLSNQIPEKRRFSDLLGEEKDCRRLTTGKRKEALSPTQQGQTKEKVRRLIDLDEEDHEQPKEQQTYRLRKSLYLQSPESIITSKQCTDYHFFNTYFYSKLNDALQNHRRQQDGVSLAKLRRWLKGVNIFEKAYIFVPIYHRLHWSLAVICIPAREDKIGPIILHLDSLGLHHSYTIFQNIRSFLKAEWEHLNQAGVPTHIPIEESIQKTWISKIETKKIEVPQQENDYDCGLFVLYFMERFIKDAPPRLIMSDLDMFGKKWFRPAEASRLRDSIKTLLEKHFEDAKNKLDAIDS